MTVAPLDEFRRLHGRSIQRLFARVDSQRWQLVEADFAAALHRSVASRFEGVATPSDADVEQYLDSLFIEDLALAGACARGDHAAWIDFLARFRPSLYRAAQTLVRDEARANEIAESLYAELYGLEERDGSRRSLFRYFHGRSSLATWLHAVVARTFVNHHRAAERSESLKEQLAADVSRAGSTAPQPAVDPDRGRYLELLRQSLSQALSQLEPRERLRLSSYHVQELTLAEVGRLLGEHESTVSRKLEQTRRALRRQVEERLRRQYKLSADQIRVCYEYALELWPFELTENLRMES